MSNIVNFAKKHGYDNAIYIGKWKDYDVYEPVNNEEGLAFTGAPLVILLREGSVRMSTVDEAYEQFEDMKD